MGNNKLLLPLKGGDSIRFERLLKKANKSRLNGKFRCPVCGCRYNSMIEADKCCRT